VVASSSDELHARRANSETWVSFFSLEMVCFLEPVQYTKLITSVVRST